MTVVEMMEPPAVPLQTEPPGKIRPVLLEPDLPDQTFRTSRPDIVGPDVPDKPFPIQLSGPVQHGFGRGSKDLGCPTANLPDESLPPMIAAAQTGVYYGYAQLTPPEGTSPTLPVPDTCVLPMVMSFGWNPFYKNERMTVEIHLLHEFASDFYGYNMKSVVLGYIRPELQYTSREALIEDIEFDKKVALKSLARPGYEMYMTDPFFTAQQL
ncbi:riboflavin kinase [Rhizopogon vinicolor AM-OR11-026]|uniref:Riboflavin kinase n=1 Tax=Rhizopogon vinicolor AM-OR11-026 TaxID=1314800 RepID=A0A1B7N2T6_9AGAM|nr:riboflavin kinase [Rhizopogon vinicolor AM-OR11-026]